MTLLTQNPPRGSWGHLFYKGKNYVDFFTSVEKMFRKSPGYIPARLSVTICHYMGFRLWGLVFYYCFYFYVIFGRHEKSIIMIFS